MQLDFDRGPGWFGRFSVRGIRIRRACGMAVTFFVGPAAMAFAFFGLGMSAVEASAVLVLLSGWLGPRLMRVEAD